MPDETPKPQTVNDELKARFPEDYAAALDALGATEEFATPVQIEAATALVMKAHSADLYRGIHEFENRKAGFTIDPEAKAFLAQRAAKYGETVDDDLIGRFASQHIDADHPLKTFEAEVTKAQENAKDQSFAERYGTPHGG